ncbi:MAG: hypothetical protein HY369_01285 [Candidatus Aenigmarchaeota archaeon]|nr:hypothetical protein [Candidatus Aenigmarchaeota archaeon]
MPSPSPDLSTVSVLALQHELKRRTAGLQQFKASRASLARQLAALDTEIAALEGARPAVRAPRPATAAVQPRKRRSSRRARRARNELSLNDTLVQTVEPGARVTPTEAAALVVRNGYATSSAKFSMVVANALRRHPGFRRIERGMYERVAAPPSAPPVSASSEVSTPATT